MAETEEMRNLIDSAILDELGQLFELEFTDSVFDHEDYYTSIPEVLDSKGYHIHRKAKSGVYLCKDELEYHVDFGAIDAVFINDMAERSLGYQHLTGFPVKFVAGNKHAGKLGNYSQALVDHFRALNVTPAQADPLVVKFFKSDKVVKNVNHETIYFVNGKELDDLGQFQFWTDEGNLKIELPTEPGYWRIDLGHMTASGHKPSTLSAWEKQLSNAGFSHKYFPSIGHLVFSNTIGASLGLPPTAHHMRWKPLELRQQPEEEAEVLPPPSDKWIGIVQAFRDDPCRLTLAGVLKSHEVRHAFRYHNRKGHVGAASKTIGNRLRAEITGYGNSVTIQEFAQFMESVTFPSGLEYYMCNMIKIGQELRFDARGNVYVH